MCPFLLQWKHAVVERRTAGILKNCSYKVYIDLCFLTEVLTLCLKLKSIHIQRSCWAGCQEFHLSSPLYQCCWQSRWWRQRWHFENWWSLIKIIGRSRVGVELAVTKGGQSFTSLWISSHLYHCSAALVLCCSGGRIISLNHFFCHCLWKKRGKNTVWEKHVFECRSLSLLVIRIGIWHWCI